MLAMIVLDLDNEMLFIPHDANSKLAVVRSDAAAEKYVTKHYQNGRLLGTFPVPTPFIKIALKERDNEKAKAIGLKNKNTKKNERRT